DRGAAPPHAGLDDVAGNALGDRALDQGPEIVQPLPPHHGQRLGRPVPALVPQGRIIAQRLIRSFLLDAVDGGQDMRNQLPIADGRNRRILLERAGQNGFHQIEITLAQGHGRHQENAWETWGLTAVRRPEGPDPSDRSTEQRTSSRWPSASWLRWAGCRSDAA